MKRTSITIGLRDYFAEASDLRASIWLKRPNPQKPADGCQRELSRARHLRGHIA